MNSPTASGSNSTTNQTHDAEATLRLIASLPAPHGIEDRVIARLHSAPHSRRIITFPNLLNPSENWLRGAAAAAIAFVVIGGGWGVYSRVQPGSATAIIPQTVHSTRFSNAGAVRVPQTLQAPVVTEPALAKPPATKAANGEVKLGARSEHRVHSMKIDKADKAPVAQPAH